MKHIPFILVTCLFAVGVAHADTTYNSSATFTAAAGGTLSTVIAFNGQSGGNYTVPSSPFTEMGSTLTYSGDAFILNGNYYGTNYAGGDFLTIDYGADTLTVTLPDTYAVSFNYGGLLAGPATIGVSLSDGFSTTFTTDDSILGTSTLDFGGIISSTPLTSITFTLPDYYQYGALDNIAFGSAATPEPSSLALLSTGLVGIGGMIRRRLRA